MSTNDEAVAIEANASEETKAMLAELRSHIVGLSVLVEFMKKNGIHRLRTAEGVEIEFESKWSELVAIDGEKLASASQPQAANANDPVPANGTAS